jgi:hypothetical protein
MSYFETGGRPRFFPEKKAHFVLIGHSPHFGFVRLQVS